MINAGGKIICKDKPGIIGAVVKYKGKNCILTVSHLVKAAGCNNRSEFKIDNKKGYLIEVLEDEDLAIIEVMAEASKLKFSDVGKANLGDAYLLTGSYKRHCSILSTGKTFHYLSFNRYNIPLPGDSGSPVFQDNKIVGILSSVFLNNATGIAISSEVFEDLENKDVGLG